MVRGVVGEEAVEEFRWPTEGGVVVEDEMERPMGQGWRREGEM